MSIARQLSDFRHWEADAAQLRQLEPDATNHASQLDLLFLPLTAQQLLRHARAHAEGTGSGVHSRDFSARSRRQGRVQPIRIGYLSDDLRDHVVGSLLAQVLELHDRRCFEIHVFDWKAPTNTIIERRLRRAGVVRHDIRELTDEQAAARIAALGMDILVDLKGYMSGHRIGILRHRAAPVQVSWLGYPGTVGDPCMDYIIADQQTIPASLEEAYSESVLRLPTVFFPHDGNRPIARPSIRAMYGLPENAFVFCYLGRSAKILPEVFEDWIRILAAVPDSVLWLRSDNTVARENLRALARSGGLATERLVFGGDEHARTAELVARYLLADLALDTCPYGSHVTASEALWACCPLITRMESTFASRVAGSLLEAAGLGELVTHSREEFRRLAIELGQDRQRVLALRRRLESTRSSNPLFDAPRFVRELELAYRMVFERFVEGLPPQSLDVPAVQGSVAGSTAAPRRR